MSLAQWIQVGAMTSRVTSAVTSEVIGDRGVRRKPNIGLSRGPATDATEPGRAHPVWPKYWNGGSACTSQGDRAYRSAELGRRVAKRLPTSSISQSHRAESEFRD